MLPLTIGDDVVPRRDGALRDRHDAVRAVRSSEVLRVVAVAPDALTVTLQTLAVGVTCTFDGVRRTTLRRVES